MTTEAFIYSSVAGDSGWIVLLAVNLWHKFEVSAESIKAWGCSKEAVHSFFRHLAPIYINGN